MPTFPTENRSMERNSQFVCNPCNSNWIPNFLHFFERDFHTKKLTACFVNTPVTDAMSDTDTVIIKSVTVSLIPVTVTTTTVKRMLQRAYQAY